MDKMSKTRCKAVSLTSILVFCTILGYGCVTNIRILKQSVSEQQFSLETWKETSNVIESQLKDSFYGKKQLIDLYGISMKAFGKSMIGNFEFARDDPGIIQRFETKVNSEPFESSLLQLQRYAAEAQIPLVFVEIPNKAEKFPLSKELNFSGQCQTEVAERLRKQGIDILSLSALMESDPTAPTIGEFFLHTDVHFSTYGEFWAAQKVVEHLQQQYEVFFHHPDIIFDPDNYQITSYEFLGNTARSAGRYFVGTDQFEVYIPKFETHFQLIDKDLNIVREGDFTEVQMNGQEKENITLYSYLVTNYGHFPEPYYEYQNFNNADGPNVLVLSDSVFMRSTAFLSLGCSNLTVVDPRYIKETAYLEYALASKDYDAIVVCGTSASFLQSGFHVKTDLPSLPTAPLQTSATWIGVNGLCIDKLNNQKPASATQLTIDPTAKTISLVGWAADFNANKPLRELYLVVGEHVIRCSYGLQRTSVSEHFGNPELTSTGFTVTFPASFLKTGAVDKLQFVQISADGSCRYAPVEVGLSYS